MKKGFTLIELLAVIVILSIILVIVVPAVQDTITNSKQKAYNVTVTSIEDAAKSYLYLNSTLYVEDFLTDGYITVTMQLLKDNGFLDKDVKDPKTSEDMMGYVIITYVSNNKYTFEFVSE
jgi:prepilin-type N-terminal cleavage/methylation domain-containing protein